jgi:hypothetical protein
MRWASMWLDETRDLSIEEKAVRRKWKNVYAPIDVEKNVCQRLADQDSSRRWVLICPNQLIGLKKRISLGSSSSWDSRPAFSVLRTDSVKVSELNWTTRTGKRAGMICFTDILTLKRCSEQFRWSTSQHISMIALMDGRIFSSAEEVQRPLY